KYHTAAGSKGVNLNPALLVNGSTAPDPCLAIVAQIFLGFDKAAEIPSFHAMQGDINQRPDSRQYEAGDSLIDIAVDQLEFFAHGMLLCIMSHYNSCHASAVRRKIPSIPTSGKTRLWGSASQKRPLAYPRTRGETRPLRASHGGFPAL